MPITPPDSERKQRQRIVRELMNKEGIDVLLVSSNGQMHQRGYLRYLSYWRTPSWEDYLIFPLDGEMTFYTHYSLRARWAKEVYGIQNVRSPPVGVRHDAYVPHMVEEIKIKKSKTVGLVGMQTMSAEFYKALAKELSNSKIVEASHILDKARSVKTGEELKLCRRAGEVADVAYKTMLDALRPGRKEYEVVADVEHAAKLNGAEEVFYMIGSGPTPELKYNAMIDRTLEQGDLVVFTLEMSGPGGYWVELSRAVSIGTPSKSVVDAHRIVALAEENALKALKSGKKVSDVGKAMLDTVKGAGYGMMGQALGHSAGLDIFEPPLISPDNETVLEPGMVFAVHPHAVTKEGAGVIVCNNHVVTDGQPEKLFKSSSDLEVV